MKLLFRRAIVAIGVLATIGWAEYAAAANSTVKFINPYPGSIQTTIHVNDHLGTALSCTIPQFPSPQNLGCSITMTGNVDRLLRVHFDFAGTNGTVPIQTIESWFTLPAASAEHQIALPIYEFTVNLPLPGHQGVWVTPHLNVVAEEARSKPIRQKPGHFKLGNITFGSGVTTRDFRLPHGCYVFVRGDLACPHHDPTTCKIKVHDEQVCIGMNGQVVDLY